MSYGIFGVVAIAFVDSALIPLPEAIDLLVITLSVKRPEWMPLYAIAATLGSVAGCLFLYYLARQGGHVFISKRVSKDRAEKIRNWFERHEFLSLMVPALLPPPVPLKAFVITAGVVEMRLNVFLLALLLGRSIRFFAEGFLAVRYGRAVWAFLGLHGLEMLLIVLGVVAVWLVILRFRSVKSV